MGHINLDRTQDGRHVTTKELNIGFVVMNMPYIDL